LTYLLAYLFVKIFVVFSRVSLRSPPQQGRSSCLQATTLRVSTRIRHSWHLNRMCHQHLNGHLLQGRLPRGHRLRGHRPHGHSHQLLPESCFHAVSVES